MSLGQNYCWPRSLHRAASDNFNGAALNSLDYTRSRNIFLIILIIISIITLIITLVITLIIILIITLIIILIIL